MTRPKDIGTAAETAVVGYLRSHGFPLAERRALAGVHDLGDVVGTPGVAWEVKGGKAAERAGDGLVEDWLAETERERRAAGADLGVLVLKRAGVGPANAGRWWAVVRTGELVVGSVIGVPTRMHLADAVRLLRGCGYGQPPDNERAS